MNEIPEAPVVAGRDVGVRIGSAEILRGVTFDVPKGQLVGLLGPNGSGKTTLLRAVSGLLPYRGELLLHGIPVTDWKARDLARRLAFVRQSVSVSFDFTVSELVLLGRSPHKRWLGDYSSADRERMAAALDRVDLSGFEARSALSLSGGELQRVFLAQALVQEADLLIFDEPTAHLDVHYQFEFVALVRELVEAGRTAVAVFHDLEMAGRFADRLLVLKQGRLAASGTPGNVLSTELIADVFRMEAHLVPETGGYLRIQYRRPVDGPRIPDPLGIGE